MSRVGYLRLAGMVGRLSWGNGIPATRVPGSATQQSPYGEPAPSHGTVHGQRLDGVRTAAWLEPAGGWQYRRDPHAVGANGGQQHPGQDAGPAGGARIGVHWLLCCGPHAHTAPPLSSAISRSWCSAASRSVLISALDAVAACGKARTTNAVPGGRVPSRSRTTCRTRRRTWWRTTEPPTAFPTTKPARVATGCPVSSRPAASGGKACTTIRGRAARRPRRVTDRKSSLRVSLAAAGSTVP